jgi:hypothetical protein
MNFAADNINSLLSLFTADQLIWDPVELMTYEIDAGVDREKPLAVLFPLDTRDVIRAVEWCRDRQVPLVARGSGTGLSGGAVSAKGGLILEFSRMKEIEEIDETSLRARFQPASSHFTFRILLPRRGCTILPTLQAPVRLPSAVRSQKMQEAPIV